MIAQHQIDEVAHALLSLHRFAGGVAVEFEKARQAVVEALEKLAAPIEREFRRSTPVTSEPQPEPGNITASVLAAANEGNPKSDPTPTATAEGPEAA